MGKIRGTGEEIGNGNCASVKGEVTDEAFLRSLT